MSCRWASRPPSATRPAPAMPPSRKARRWKTPCRSLTSSKKIAGSAMRPPSAEPHVGVFEHVDQPIGEGEEDEGGEELPPDRDQAGHRPVVERDGTKGGQMGQPG